MNIPSANLPPIGGEDTVSIIGTAFAKAIDKMKAYRTAGIHHIGNVATGPTLGDLKVGELAYLHNHPEHPMRAEVEQLCNGRPNPMNPDARIPCPDKSRFKCMAYFADFTACDNCRNAAIAHENGEKAKTYWESICPDAYLDTTEDFAGDKTHSPPIAPFPSGLFGSLADYRGQESLFIYAPSGSAKTRCAMLLMKRCLHNNLHVGCLWPEELKHAAHSYNDRLTLLKKYARFDLLLLDDALLTGAQDEKMASFLQDLVDMLMRSKHHFIITSQIGGDDYKEQANKSDKTTKVDHDRIDALLRRIREVCRVVPFITATPAAGSDAMAF